MAAVGVGWLAVPVLTAAMNGSMEGVMDRDPLVWSM